MFNLKMSGAIIVFFSILYMCSYHILKLSFQFYRFSLMNKIDFFLCYWNKTIVVSLHLITFFELLKQWLNEKISQIRRVQKFVLIFECNSDPYQFDYAECVLQTVCPLTEVLVSFFQYFYKY